MDRCSRAGAREAILGGHPLIAEEAGASRWARAAVCRAVDRTARFRRVVRCARRTPAAPAVRTGNRTPPGANEAPDPWRRRRSDTRPRSARGAFPPSHASRYLPWTRVPRTGAIPPPAQERRRCPSAFRAFGAIPRTWGTSALVGCVVRTVAGDPADLRNFLSRGLRFPCAAGDPAGGSRRLSAAPPNARALAPSPSVEPRAGLQSAFLAEGAPAPRRRPAVRAKRRVAPVATLTPTT